MQIGIDIPPYITIRRTMSSYLRSSASFRFVLNIKQEAGIALGNGSHIKTCPEETFKTCDGRHQVKTSATSKSFGMSDLP